MVTIATAPSATVRPRHAHLHPRVLGTMVGLTGATSFVLANRGGLPILWAHAALAAWALLLGGALWALFLDRRPLPAPTAPHRHAGRIYVASVVGMLVAIRLGAALAATADQAYLVPAIVVTAVGLHFVPFAVAFGASVFTRLGWTLTAIGTAGVMAGLVWGAVPVAAAATCTGLVMLTFLLVDTLRERSRPPHP